MTTHPSFFNGEIPLSNGVYYLVLPNSNLFGYYSYLPDARYIYHFDLNYEFVVDANDGKGGLYMYDFASGHWWYTGAQFPFPYIYDFSLNALLYYYPATGNAGHYTTSPRYFFNFATNAIVTLPADSAPAVGYLAAGAGGGVAGTLNNVNSSVMVIGISGAHAAGGPNTTIGTANVTINAGVGISSARRAPLSVPASEIHAPLERPVESPEEYRKLISGLRPAVAGTRVLDARRTSSLPTTAGSQNTFWVSQAAIGTSGSSYAQRPATLRQVSTHGYIWIDNSLSATMTDATVGLIARDFDNAYTSDTTHFGTPVYTATSPGANGHYPACDATGAPVVGSVPTIVPPVDDKITVFVVDSIGLGGGVGGYFSPTNYTPQAAWNCLIGGAGGYTASTVPRSNEAPMIYVGFVSNYPLNFETDEDLVRGTAHEFQHLINFVNHGVLYSATPSYEDTWINEGLSMLAQDLAVKQLFGISNDVGDAVWHAQTYLATPEYVSVTGFTSVDPNTNVQSRNCNGCYGAEYLFQRYMYDRFGGDVYLNKMIATSATSYANLTQATGGDATQELSDFAVALAASGTGVTSDPRFNFVGLNLRATLTDQFGSTRTLNGPSPVTLAPGTYPQLLGSFLYLTGDASTHGKTVTLKEPTGTFALRGAVIQR